MIVRLCRWEARKEIKAERERMAKQRQNELMDSLDGQIGGLWSSAVRRLLPHGFQYFLSLNMDIFRAFLMLLL